MLVRNGVYYDRINTNSRLYRKFPARANERLKSGTTLQRRTLMSPRGYEHEQTQN